MTEYTCPRCGFLTNVRSKFIDHLQRKNPCKASIANVSLEPVLANLQEQYNTKPYECCYCNKRFSHKPSMYTHKKHCKQRPTERVVADNSVSTNVSGNSNNLITGGTNNTINHFHIHINPAEYAKSSFVTDKMYQDLISSVNKPGKIDGVLLKMVKILFCNVSHPENYCVYIPNKKYNRALLWDGSSWKFEETLKAVEKIRNKAYYLIVDYYDEHDYKFGVYTQQEWNAFIERVKSGEGSVFKTADQQIKLELLSNTAKVKDHIKDKKVYSDSSRWDTGL
jgi:hypothetical protein